MNVRKVVKKSILGKIHLAKDYMSLDAEKGRTLVDVTGVLFKPKEERTQLPVIKQRVPLSFFERAHQLAHMLRDQPYEYFARRLFGFGNPLKRMIFDQNFKWNVLRREDIERLQEETISPFEKLVGTLGKHFRDPQWMSRAGTGIELDDFDLDYNQVLKLHWNKDDKTIVSGNPYYERRDLVKKIKPAMTNQLDPDLGIILPPHYDVGSGKLKVASALWFPERVVNPQRVSAEEDDYAIALLYTAAGAVVRMPITEKQAKNQPHVEDIIVKSGVSSRIKESNIKFMSA